MYSTKSFVLLKLGLSPLIINYLHTLHTELNTFISSSHSNPNQPLPSAKEILEGIFQIIGWDIKAQISLEEFTILFTEWNKAKGSSLSSSKLFDIVHRNHFLIDQIIIALRNSSSSQNDFSIHLVKAIETLTQVYDDFVCSNNDLGLDIKGHNVHAVEQGNLTLMNEIFRTFDQKEQGHLTLDTLFFFYIAFTELQKNENILKPEDEESFCQNLNTSFKDFLDHIKCFQGRITASQMKTYLLYNGIASKNDLNSLRKSMRNIIEMGEEINEHGFNETGGLLPDLLQMSLKRTFPHLNLSDLSQNPTDLQLFYHFILVRFYPYIHEQEYFEGLLISNKTLLAQMLFKEFKKYYGDDVFRTVQWSFDPAQTLLSLVKAYNEAANELLHLYFQCKLQGKQQNNNQSVTVRTSYFQDTPSIGRNNSIQEYTGRPSRIMLSGRNTEANNSFREMSQFTEASEILMALPLQKEPSVTSVNKSSARGMSEGRTRAMNKENTVASSSSRLDSSRRTPSVGPQKKKQQGNNKTSNSHKKENNMTRDLSPIANPQSLRKVLEEVDNNYAKKFLSKGPIMNNRDRKILGDPEHLMKVQEFTSSQLPHNSRRDSGPFEIDMSIKARSQLGTETKSSAASKPPLKSGANSTVTKHLQSQTNYNYESFNPRYHEKQPHITEPEDVSYSIPKIKEFEPHIKANPVQTTPDQSFFEEKIQSETWTKVAPKSIDMGRQNRQAWQQEKRMLDSMIKRRMSQGYFEENVDENKDSQDSMSNADNRRASMISQQSLTSVVENNNQKSLRNKNMMDILNKLENKMFENQGKIANIANDISSSHRSKSSIDSKHDDGKSILDIMKDHITKDSSNVPAEIYEDKKEFHININLQELIGESKKAPIHSNIRKASQPKVYSMSIAEHMQPVAKKENQKTPFGTNTTATPTKEVKGLMSKEGSQMKSIEKRIPLQESGNSRSLLAMKARQSSSKSPANSRSGRAMKTESFEVVMARLKKTPGNTPTKGNVKRNMVY